MHASPMTHPRAAFGTAVLFLSFAILGWALLRESEAQFSNFVMPGDPGPFFLARLCLSAIFLAGLGMAGRGLLLMRRSRLAPEPSGEQPSLRRWLLPAGFTFSLLAMPALMAAAGSTAAIFLFSLPWILILQAREKRLAPWTILGALAAASAAAGFVALVFIRLLNVPLPT